MSSTYEMKSDDFVGILLEISNPASSLKSSSVERLLSTLCSTSKNEESQIYDRESFFSSSSSGHEPFTLCVEILSKLDTSEYDLATALQQILLSVVRSNGIGPRHLRKMFQLLLEPRGSFCIGSGWLLKTMTQMAGLDSVASGLRRFFVLDGLSGIYLGGDFQWAWDKGWALDCDVWLDPASLASGQDVLLLRMIGGEEVPGREGVAFEVLLSAQGAAVATGQGAARTERRCGAALPRGGFAHVAVSYTHHQIKTSEVVVYIDGQRAAASLKYQSPQV